MPGFHGVTRGSTLHLNLRMAITRIAMEMTRTTKAPTPTIVIHTNVEEIWEPSFRVLGIISVLAGGGGAVAVVLLFSCVVSNTLGLNKPPRPPETMVTESNHTEIHSTTCIMNQHIPQTQASKSATGYCWFKYTQRSSALGSSLFWLHNHHEHLVSDWMAWCTWRMVMWIFCCFLFCHHTLSSSPWILSLTLEEDNPRGLIPPHIVFLYSQNETPQDSTQIKIQAHPLLHSLHERACSLLLHPRLFLPPQKPKLLAWKNRFCSQKQRNRSPCRSPFLLGGSFGSSSWKIICCEIQSPGSASYAQRGAWHSKLQHRNWRQTNSYAIRYEGK